MPSLRFWRWRLLLQQHVHAHGKTQYDGENKHKKQQHDALASQGWVGMCALCERPGRVQVGINNAATPAPPSIPTANTNMEITVLTSRLYLLWTLDMVSSLRCPLRRSPIHSVPIVTRCMKQITFGSEIAPPGLRAKMSRWNAESAR